MECYICHNLIERHEYTRHVGSHLAGNDVDTRSQTNTTLPTFSYDKVDYDHYGSVFPAHSAPRRTPLGHDHPLRPVTPTPYHEFQSDDLVDFLPQLTPPENHRKAHFTPSRSPASTTRVPDRVPQQETPAGQSAQPNAFQLWLKNHTHDSPKYTTVDGQKSQPDSQVQQLIQAAKVLRGTTKQEVIKIVEQFGGYSCSDKKTCLELVKKVPIFPVGRFAACRSFISCPM